MSAFLSQHYLWLNRLYHRDPADHRHQCRRSRQPATAYQTGADTHYECRPRHAPDLPQKSRAWRKREARIILPRPQRGAHRADDRQPLKPALGKKRRMLILSYTPPGCANLPTEVHLPQLA